jgi:phospholipid/cholesterol/gamma-HCH transport system substrate-binding protein
VKFKPGATLVILLIMTLVGAAYMSLGVLDVGPTKKVTRVTLLLDSSGGLLPTSQVTMRGIKVGKVAGIQTTARGLAVSLDLDGDYSVPIASPVRVENLSGAGEQYIDFRPELISPPYLSDGSVIPADRVAPTVTVSQLLARADALISALNPEDVRTIVSNVSTAFTDNDATLESLATASGLFAKMVQENRELLATLFSNVSTLTTGLGDVNTGAVFSETGKMLPSVVPQFIRLIGEFNALSHTGQDIFGTDQAVGDLVGKLGVYVDTLAVPLSTFATVLQPATAPLRKVKVDAGHWLDFWESTFSDAGGVRVQLTVPEWNQP